MSRLIITALFLLAVSCGPSRKGTAFKPGKYFNFIMAPELNESIQLKKDSSFHYEFSFKLGQRFVDGKWRISNDTIELYDFTQPEVIRSVEEKTNTAQDHIRLAFNMGELGGQRLRLTDFLEVTINGDCHNKYFPDSNGVVVIPAQPLKKIEFNYAYYRVKNPQSNDITFNLSPLVYMVSPKDMKQNRWVYRDNRLFKVECEGADTIFYFEHVKSESVLKQRLKETDTAKKAAKRAGP